MDKNTSEDKPGCCGRENIRNDHHGDGKSNPIYGLGVVGALFYFLKGATTFSTIMMGIGKSIFWPAILMFKLLTYLKI